MRDPKKRKIKKLNTKNFLRIEEGKACYIPLKNKDQKCLNPETVLKKIKPLLEDPSIKKIGQNMKYDYIIFKKK